MEKDYLFENLSNREINKQQSTLYVVVAKPTRVCNAQCSYCSSPPLTEMGSDWEPEWSFDTFRNYFDKVFPYMVNGAFWIWHGGEPLLMGHEFYQKCYDYAKECGEKSGKIIRFSMQSNLLGYNEKWKKIFSDVLGGSLSTSYDPDESNRTIKGSWENYSKIFKRSLDKVIDDGFYPMVIGVYKEENAHKMHEVYDWSLSRGSKSFPIRFNYCVPTGRVNDGGELISPITYGKKLIEVYNRWIKDLPDFTITPLDQMFKKTIGADGDGHCPWQKSCGGRFLAIEPNGDIYNCTDFADLGNDFSFGNLNEMTIPELLTSKQALDIKRRSYKLPETCMNCEHYIECEGGCARDSLLFGHGMYGKFHYCRSWKMVFTRIKESIINGEADGAIIKYGFEPDKVRKYLEGRITNHFNDSINWNSFLNVNNPFGFGENLISNNIKYDDYGRILNSNVSDKIYPNDPGLKKKKVIPIKIINT